MNVISSTANAINNLRPAANQRANNQRGERAASTERAKPSQRELHYQRLEESADHFESILDNAMQSNGRNYRRQSGDLNLGFHANQLNTYQKSLDKIDKMADASSYTSFA